MLSVPCCASCTTAKLCPNDVNDNSADNSCPKNRRLRLVMTAPERLIGKANEEAGNPPWITKLP